MQPKSIKNISDDPNWIVEDWDAEEFLKDSEEKEKTKTQLQKWAHEGTKEALKKINDFIDKKENKDLRWYAEMSRDEAECFYYGPNTDQEEEYFFLARIAMYDDLECKIEAAKFELKKLALEEKVHDALMKKVSAKQRENWKYNSSEDNIQLAEGRLAGLEDDIKYFQERVKIARGMIKTKKYSDIPARTLRNIKLDFEDVNFWGDDRCDDCGCDGKDIDVDDIPF
jgi:hypothetical protein